MLDSHVRTQLGGFYYRYNNFQFTETNLTNGQSGISNLPTATIYGVEASIQARLGSWGADGGISYVHSNLPSGGPFVNTHLLPPNANGLPQCTAGVVPPACFDYTPYLQTAASGPNLYSPEWTVNLGLEYRANLTDSISLTPRINYAYQDSQFTSLTYSEVTDYLPSHNLLSALLTLKVHDHWSVQAYGTNLNNTIYRTGQGLNNGNYYFYGAPRQYGLRADYQF